MNTTTYHRKKGHLSPSERRRAVECGFDVEAASIIKELQARDVQLVQDQADLYREHQRNLARYQRTGVDLSAWRRLKRCSGDVCPNYTCSAGCAFGAQYTLNKLVLEADDLAVARDLAKFFVTWIDPGYFLPQGALSGLSVKAMFQNIRRRLRTAPENWENAIAVGSVHLAFDVNLDGSRYWSPHVHLMLGVDASEDMVRQVFRPTVPRTYARANPGFRPVVATKATAMTNGISYVTKRLVDVRVEDLDERENSSRWNDLRRMPEEAQRELDEYLLTKNPGDRVFLYGMMRSRGGLVLRGRN